jgi:hypothetical protein
MVPGESGGFRHGPMELARVDEDGDFFHGKIPIE